jgi:hypothetical protein
MDNTTKQAVQQSVKAIEARQVTRLEDVRQLAVDAQVPEMPKHWQQDIAELKPLLGVIKLPDGRTLAVITNEPTFESGVSKKTGKPFKALKLCKAGVMQFYEPLGECGNWIIKGKFELIAQHKLDQNQPTQHKGIVVKM